MRKRISKLVAPLCALASASCSNPNGAANLCSSVKAESYTRPMSSAQLASALVQRDAPGGEIVVEFRKDDLLGPPTHSKSCAFFLEPSGANSEGGSLWTAAHCLDLSRDSKYRLRFFVDMATGYVEVPVEIESLKKVQQLRTNISNLLSDEGKRKLLSSLRQKDIDYSNSTNAQDICLQSFGSGKSVFHEPLPPVTHYNQIACFLYQDLRLLDFSLPPDLDQMQRRVISFTLEKARNFEKLIPIPATATIKFGSQQLPFSELKGQWINAYKAYTKNREQDGFVAWLKQMKQECTTSSDELCREMDTVRTAFAKSGLDFQVELFDVNKLTAFADQYLSTKRKIVELWKFFSKSEALFDGKTVKPYNDWSLLTNYNWNGGDLRSFSDIGIGGFWGLGFGSTIGADGTPRDRVGGATYDWNSAKEEMFIYSIFPKTQTLENLNLGYAQLRLRPGDSGSMILANGLPMAVLATVDGEKTSGGAAVLPLPENNGDPEDEVAGTQVITQRNSQRPQSGSVGCAK
jgi:hypothetical protein